MSTTFTKKTTSINGFDLSGDFDNIFKNVSELIEKVSGQPDGASVTETDGVLVITGDVKSIVLNGTPVWSGESSTSSVELQQENHRLRLTNEKLSDALSKAEAQLVTATSALQSRQDE